MDISLDVLSVLQKRALSIEQSWADCDSYIIHDFNWVFIAGNSYVVRLVLEVLNNCILFVKILSFVWEFDAIILKMNNFDFKVLFQDLDLRKVVEDAVDDIVFSFIRVQNNIVCRRRDYGVSVPNNMGECLGSSLILSRVGPKE